MKTIWIDWYRTARNRGDSVFASVGYAFSMSSKTPMERQEVLDKEMDASIARLAKYDPDMADMLYRQRQEEKERELKPPKITSDE
jgi:hypothetical protein